MTLLKRNSVIDWPVVFQDVFVKGSVGLSGIELFRTFYCILS